MKSGRGSRAFKPGLRTEMETSMSTETPKLKRTHAIYQVMENDKKSRWVRIGAARTNKDGKGLFLKFDAYPVTGKTVIREISDQPREDGGAE